AVRAGQRHQVGISRIRLVHGPLLCPFGGRPALREGLMIDRVGTTTAHPLPKNVFHMMWMTPPKPSAKGGLAGSTVPAPWQVKQGPRSLPACASTPVPLQVGHANGSQPRGPGW